MPELNIEHHAIMNTDDIEELAKLFNEGAVSLKLSIRGRTTVSKAKSKLSDIGIKRFSHTYIDIQYDNAEFTSQDEITRLVKQYKQEGVNNIYAVNLEVTWQNGDMHNWSRRVVHVQDKESIRNFPSGRFNTLVMPIKVSNSLEYVEALRIQYGGLVAPTKCINSQVEPSSKRLHCMGIVTPLKNTIPDGT